MKTQKQSKIRYCFTLVEIMVAITILALLGAGIGWHVSKLISHHRFESEAADICLALQEAQFLSVIHQTECELVIYTEKAKLFYQLKTDEPLAVINQKAIPLKESRYLTLNHTSSPHATFKINSSGRIEPTAILGLHQKNPKEAQLQGIWLDLQTPVQIKMMHQKPSKIAVSLPQKPENGI